MGDEVPEITVDRRDFFIETYEVKKDGNRERIVKYTYAVDGSCEELDIIGVTIKRDGKGLRRVAHMGPVISDRDLAEEMEKVGPEIISEVLCALSPQARQLFQDALGP